MLKWLEMNEKLSKCMLIYATKKQGSAFDISLHGRFSAPAPHDIDKYLAPYYCCNTEVYMTYKIDRTIKSERAMLLGDYYEYL